MPQLEVHDCQETVSLDLADVTLRLATALPLVLKFREGPEEAVLIDLQNVEISIIDDEAIADVHGRFMDDPTATDVITFQHGEILASADTAAREAVERGWPVERELLLYLIHGLLHLHGYGDLEPHLREEMHGIQDQLLDQVWPLPG